ncbi:MAG: arginine N-succinyltransferase [Maricaulaceae bacterium]|nr:arginine N-succinyltransferase [Maricaulaceae bacterium]
MLVVRAARRSDIDALAGLARAAGPGFTSLAVGPDKLVARLAASEAAFASAAGKPVEAAYQLMLEDGETGRVIGSAAVKDMVGVTKPYFDFKIVTLAQASKEADRRFDMEMMLLVNDFAGAAEVGSLFVDEAARGTGAGRLIAQARYMLIAAEPQRFGKRVLAELRGVVREDGSSPFFDHVTRPFFRMTFAEADRMSAETDNQFILDLMPNHPIYLDLLPKAARDVVGVTHPTGAGARKLLEWEGLTYDRYIDIFDGGPLMSASVDDVRTIRESRALTARAATALDEPAQALVSTGRFADFRACFALVETDEDCVWIEPAAMKALNLIDGEPARVWIRS